MSVSQNFSLTRPSLALDFAKSQKLDPRITFTRTSSATRVNEDGYIQTVSAGSPRFNFNPLTGNCQGLLIEEQRTNLILRSEELNNASWTQQDNLTYVLNTITSPNGTLSSNYIAGNNIYPTVLGQTVSVSASSTNDYFATVYAAQGTNNYFTFNVYYIGNGEDNVDFNFNTLAVTGAPNSDYFMESLGNGWYRCGFRISRDSTGTRTNIAYRIWPGGRSVNAGGAYFWGAQLEAGAFPTSYIPTTTISVTRTVEIAQITGTNFSNFYNPIEGTLTASFRINRLGGGTFPGIVYVDDTSINNTIGFYVNDGFNDLIGFESYISNVPQCTLFSASAPIPGQSYKLAGGYKLNDMATSFSTNSTVQTDSVAGIPAVGRMIIGLLRGNNSPLNGTISNISYYPSRLSDSQLLTLTR